MSKQKEKKLVIVESPIKAKTISRFLGSEYVVESCMGHIRDLPSSSKELPEKIKKKSWSHFGVDVENGFQPFYCVPAEKKEIVKKLKDKLGSVKELILATDEDREGESISWHLQEILKPKVPVKRMVFHEITKSAIEMALKNFRSIDNNLVQAQEARRILDRLVGYSISPVLWKKIVRGLSAGRVQSVAVSLVSARELDRLAFTRSVYWDLSAENKAKGSSIFNSRLVSYKGKRLVRSSDFDSTTGKLKKANVLSMTEKQALSLSKSVKGKSFKVTAVEKKKVNRRPQPPFITSTLQQECNRKLRFSSKQTMSLAQKLYEQGLITYMRTDSTFLSSQAVKAARAKISAIYGADNLPSIPRVYSKKAKGAQEAHEAIRPAGERFVEPKKTNLSGQMLSLYELVWKRTLASQMKDCVQNQVRVEMEVDDCMFQSSGVTIDFPGFYLVYEDQRTDEVQLPSLKEGDAVSCLKVEALKHETKPPARYTEASLIQTLEKEGVGRPSTYASIIGTIQDRGYVKKEKNTLIPTFTALVVSHFLNEYFPNYVDTQFTSEMEKDLDDIARGKKDHVKYLKSVYMGPKGLKKLIEDQEKKMEKKTFRSMTLKGFEDYLFNVGPFGAYVSKKGSDVSASLPAGIYPGEITKESIDEIIAHKMNGGRSLGDHPKTGKEIFVVLGKYGPYVKMDLEEDTKKDDSKNTKNRKGSKKKAVKKKAKTASLSPFFEADTVTLKDALKLLELPKSLGLHPETKEEVKKSVGRFGPYIVHAGDFRSVPADVFFDIDLKYALKVFSEPKRKSSRALKELGQHPDSNKPVQLMKGRFGPYLKYNNKNYSLPGDVSVEKINLSSALEVIAEGQKKTKSSFVKKVKKTVKQKKSLSSRYTKEQKIEKKTSSKKSDKKTKSAALNKSKKKK